jgi:hypothetical protein
MCDPIVAVTISAMAATMQIVGQRQQAQAQERQFEIEQQNLARQQAVIAQDRAAEAEQEAQRQQLLTEEGRRQRGDIRVAQAAMGQLVDTGSAADKTAELAGEVAFKKRISERESALRQRNFDIRLGSLELERGALGERRSAARTASRFQTGSTILGAASTVATKFKFGKDGDLKFRTQ